jgi:hypothetical protein
MTGDSPLFYPDVPTRLRHASRTPLPEGRICGAQVDVVRLLVDPQTYGGRKPAYFDTAVSHLIVDDRNLYILRKAIDHDGSKCATLEDRWNWCEAQCMQGVSLPGAVRARPLPVARREGQLHLGGPGSIRDWVLKITYESVLVDAGFITLRCAA